MLSTLWSGGSLDGGGAHSEMYGPGVPAAVLDLQRSSSPAWLRGTIATPQVSRPVRRAAPGQVSS